MDSFGDKELGKSVEQAVIELISAKKEPVFESTNRLLNSALHRYAQTISNTRGSATAAKEIHDWFVSAYRCLGLTDLLMRSSAIDEPTELKTYLTTISPNFINREVNVLGTEARKTFDDNECCSLANMLSTICERTKYGMNLDRTVSLLGGGPG